MHMSFISHRIHPKPFRLADRSLVSIFVGLFLLTLPMAIVYGFLTFPAVKVFAVLAGFALLLLAAFSPQFTFYVVVVYLVVHQEAETTPGSIFAYLEKMNRPGIPSLLEALIVLLAAAFFVSCLLQIKEYRYPRSKVFLLCFVAVLMASIVVGLYNGNDPTWFKEDLKRFTLPVLFFVAAANLVDDSRKIRLVMALVFLAATAKTYLAIFYYLAGLGFPYGDSKVVFLESGDQIFVVTTIIAGISLMIEGMPRLRKIVFFVVALLPMIYALVFSYRRNALWGTVLSLGLVLLLSPWRQKVRMLRYVWFAVAGVLVMLSLSRIDSEAPAGRFVTERMASVADATQSSNVAHLAEWVVTMDAIRGEPVLGMGLGAVHGLVPGFESLNTHTVHNAFLMLWMKLGIGGLLLLCYCLIGYVRLGIREARARRDMLQIGLFATCAQWLVAMMVGPSWWYYRETCFMALVAAVVIGLGRQKAVSQVQEGGAVLSPMER